jgi:hypothetical protein
MTQNEKLIKNLENMTPIDLDDIPKYYKGKNGYMAKDVVSNFNLSYNIGTAVTYLLRSKNKHNDGGVEDIRKAINHLHFELDRLYDEV